MKLLPALLLLSTLPALADVRVHYLRTGKEEAEEAAFLGRREVESGNPCVLAMKKELEKWAGTTEAKDALAYLKKKEPGISAAGLAWGLRFSASRMEVLVEDTLGTFRKGLVVSNEPGSWKERMRRKECVLPGKKLAALAAEIREPDLLEKCVLRKRKLIEKAEPVARVLKHDVEPSRLSTAWASLGQKGKMAQNLLREDMQVYRDDNASLRGCERGLKRLELEAATSVAVLRELGPDESQARRVEELEAALKD